MSSVSRVVDAEVGGSSDGLDASRSIVVCRDAEVPGDEPCVMVDFGEIGDYAKRD